MKLVPVISARRVALVIAACVPMSGCMSSTPIWDAHFGEAARSVAAAQIIHPDAPEGPATPGGIDGKAAAAAMDNYDRSFVQPTPSQNVYVIGVGNGSSGGSGGQ
ncbi:hypothetical protein [Paraburkholderia phosphatilytica]|uniref:hypothetical protein n=1 Tax=Paraburkholderia phosphatilytica TaxID=2282883 RepID=UPI000E543EDE|nr:hypothetical protein [Paraburkholderia phosphatilytica]